MKPIQGYPGNKDLAPITEGKLKSIAGYLELFIGFPW